MRPGNGFTLIEMMVVLSIMGLLGGLVLLRGPQRNAAVDMRQATSLVAGDFRVARSQAIARNRPVSVQFASDGASLQVGDAALQRLPPGIRMVAGARQILFRPDGSSTGGEVRLAGGARIAALTVNWLTGRVTKTP